MLLTCGACSPPPLSAQDRSNFAAPTVDSVVSMSSSGSRTDSERLAPTTVASTSITVVTGERQPESNDRELVGSENSPHPKTSPQADRPPKNVEPPFPATASAGDGVWRAFGAEADGRALMWRTGLHPHERSRFVSVEVVAVDLQRFRLEWVVGAGDVGAQALADKQTPGLISGTWASEVVAVFNGGFQARHGYWGQQSHGVTLVKPKSDGCGIALFNDGGVAFGHHELATHAGLVTYRQTPPCLVAEGRLNPRLGSGQDGIWAGNSTKEKTRRRSAAGLSAEQHTLFYLVGVEAAPVDLARALEALGVDYGLQLDINWNWTRFFLVEKAADASANLSEPLLSSMVADKGEYVRRPSKRDFFAVVKRPAEQ